MPSCLGKLDGLGWTYCLVSWSDWIQCVYGISPLIFSKWSLCYCWPFSVWKIYEKLFTSVLIFTLCMDVQSEWLCVSSQGKRSPCVRLHVPMTTGIPLWKRMKASIIFVCGEKQIYKVRQLLVIWSVSMRRWERWSVHKNTEDVHTYTKPKQTLLQDEMMNIWCTYMETTLTVVYFDI